MKKLIAASIGAALLLGGCSTTDDAKEGIEKGQTQKETEEQKEIKGKTVEKEGTTDTPEKGSISSPATNGITVGEPNGTTEIIDERIKTVEEVVVQYIESKEKEDLDRYYNLMAKAIVEAEKDNPMMQEIFDNFQIDYLIKEMKVLQLNDKEAKVHILLESKALEKKEGAEYIDGTVGELLTLVPEDGVWKIASSEILKVYPENE